MAKTVRQLKGYREAQKNVSHLICISLEGNATYPRVCNQDCRRNSERKPAASENLLPANSPPAGFHSTLRGHGRQSQ